MALNTILAGSFLVKLIHRFHQIQISDVGESFSKTGELILPNVGQKLIHQIN